MLKLHFSEKPNFNEVTDYVEHYKKKTHSLRFSFFVFAIVG